jgi:hypothetical protein
MVFSQLSMSLMTRSASSCINNITIVRNTGDNIAIKGSSPQHVVDIFCTFGLQIREAKTESKPAETETKPEKTMDTTSRKKFTVVEGTLQPSIFLMLSMNWQE